MGLVTRPAFIRSASHARRHGSEVLDLIHEAGNPYYNWFFGGPEPARAALEALFASASSEISAARVTLLLTGDALAGMFIGLDGRELAECRLADALLLFRSAQGEERTALIRHAKAARDLFATVPSDAYYLSKIGVARAARGQGLGRMLLDRFLAEGRRKGYRRFWLDVPATNSRALALYSSRGFEPVRKRRLGQLAYVEMALEKVGGQA
ncbi:MAG TPA: GNAT family N-acetyltransferase [Gaiellaceae bacterium]|nr:GNAT family N-acetyltransferase [Gaiellaceae bacterium]